MVAAVMRVGEAGRSAATTVVDPAAGVVDALRDGPDNNVGQALPPVHLLRTWTGGSAYPT